MALFPTTLPNACYAPTIIIVFLIWRHKMYADRKNSSVDLARYLLISNQIFFLFDEKNLIQNGKQLRFANNKLYTKNNMTHLIVLPLATKIT